MRHKALVLFLGLSLVLLATSVSFTVYLDSRWQGYVAGLQESQAGKLEDAGRARFAEGYWRSFYDFCYAATENKIRCLLAVRKGYYLQIHAQDAAPGWDWTFVKDLGRRRG